MSEIKPDTVIKGVSYVIWVKDQDDLKTPDLMYGVVHRGNSRFGYQDFEYVCKEANMKFFKCNKVNGGIENSTWSDCVYEMKVRPKPMGTPILMSDRAFTFAEVAALAYKEGIFTSDEGLKLVSKRTAPAVPHVKVNGSSGNAKVNNGSSGNAKVILQDAKEMSDNLDKERSSCTLPDNPLFPGASLEHLDTSPEDEDLVMGDRIDVNDEEVVDEEYENIKERAVMAESLAENLQERNEHLEAKLKDLNKKLNLNVEQQQQFMMAADRTAANLELMNDDTADKVLQKLEPKLAGLSSLGNGLKDILTMVENIRTAVSGQAQSMNDRFDRVVGRIDNSNQSLSEGIMTIRDSLYHFGLATDVSSINIPACIQALANVPSTTDTIGGNNGAAKVCDFTSKNVPAVMVCKCGCGYELVLDPSEYGGSGGVVGAEGDMVEGGVSSAANKGFSIDRTGGVKQYNADPSNIYTSQPPHYSNPPPQTSHTYHQSAPITPGNGNNFAIGSGTGMPPALTRKQKKAIKHRELKAKKLKWTLPELAAGSGVGPSKPAQQVSSANNTFVLPNQSQNNFVPPNQSPKHFVPPNQSSNRFVRPGLPPRPRFPQTIQPGSFGMPNFRGSTPQVWAIPRLQKPN